MERKSALRMFLLPFLSFCASACFQVSGLIKNLNDNHHEDGNGDSVKVFCFVGVGLSSLRFGYCIASGCWDNPNYQNNPTYWMTEYISIILNALTNVVNSDTFQIIAFTSGVISIAWNLVHAISWIEIQCPRVEIKCPSEFCNNAICLFIALSICIFVQTYLLWCTIAWIFDKQLPTIGLLL